jgi:hypothetical protein
MKSSADHHPASVDLYWIPLGAGEPLPLVRWSGHAFEALVSRLDHRPPCDLYHSALEVHVNGERFVIEMTPVWGNSEPDRGVVGEGAVGLPMLGRSRFFRYEVRRWRNGVIPDVSAAAGGPQRLSTDCERAQLVLDLVPRVPRATWGRDELGGGEMWNSNSLTSWLLVRSGHSLEEVALPPHARAPGWSSGLNIARRYRDPSPAFPHAA